MGGGGGGREGELEGVIHLSVPDTEKEIASNLYLYRETNVAVHLFLTRRQKLVCVCVFFF